MITLCPHCQWKGKVKDELAGKNAKCPKCKEVFTIKDAETVENDIKETVEAPKPYTDDDSVEESAPVKKKVGKKKVGKKVGGKTGVKRKIDVGGAKRGGRASAKAGKTGAARKSRGRKAAGEDLSTETAMDMEAVNDASFVQRAVSLIIDSVIVMILVLGPMFVFVGSAFLAMGGEAPAPEDADAAAAAMGITVILGYFLAMILPAAYCIVMEAKGGTVGKKVMGLAIVTEDGEKPGFVKALLRYIGRMPSSFLMIGYILYFVSKKKQTLHDLIAGTFVVKK